MFAFIGFSVRRGWSGFWGNASTSLAATATTVLMLLLLSGVLILLTGLNSTLDYVQQESPVVALLKESATQGEIDALQASLKAMPASVSRHVRLPGRGVPRLDSPIPRHGRRHQLLARQSAAVCQAPSLPSCPKDNLAVAAFVKSQPTVYAPINNQQTVDQMITAHWSLPSWRRGHPDRCRPDRPIIHRSTRFAWPSSRARTEIEIMRLVEPRTPSSAGRSIFEGVLLGLIGAAITIGVLFLGRSDSRIPLAVLRGSPSRGPARQLGGTSR